jgi:hypothetical protein
MSIPLCDDVWLGMQAQHIAAVEIGIIRPLELHTARKIFNEEGYADVMMALNGVSQMWLFALYEFLRTWRQRAATSARRPVREDQTCKAEGIPFQNPC